MVHQSREKQSRLIDIGIVQVLLGMIDPRYFPSGYDENGGQAGR